MNLQELQNWLRARLRKHPLSDIGEDEMEVHFAGMPWHYWERVNQSDLVWGLETIHGFLQIVATPNVPATAPFLSWRHDPSSGWTRVMLCTWDRPSLLAKCAACFSAVKLNISQAEVFNRADNLALDVFRVREQGSHSPASPARLRELAFLLDGALSEPPRFASVWACSRHKFLASPPRIGHRIRFDNDSAADSTVLRVEASDRLGLLYDIVQALADNGVNITQAHIQTDDDVARDTLQLTDSEGRKILDPAQLERLRRCLEDALAVIQ